MAIAQSGRSAIRGAGGSPCASCDTRSRPERTWRKTTFPLRPAKSRNSIPGSRNGKNSGLRGTRRKLDSMKVSLRLCAGLLCLLVPALAVDWKALKPQGYGSDFADGVDPQSKAAIDGDATAVQQAPGAQLAFGTVQSVEGEPIEDVANDLFHNWGIGRKGEDDGALLLLATRAHKSRLEVGGGLGGAVPDGMAGLLLDDMRPALRQNQYGPALLAAAERLGSTIAQSKGVTIQAPAPRYH